MELVDLQRVVNGLWAAGAEAVAVNGQRVTGLTAIRSANDVVLDIFADAVQRNGKRDFSLSTIGSLCSARRGPTDFRNWAGWSSGT